MTVIDVNTGKFTGSGGSLEETVTSNNLEAAEEIVRQMRLRDLGGMIIVDFIDMILPENQELVLRRLKEALGRDRTRHQVSEVTSLGLVQMTRKRLGTGLLETFSTECECCGGRGIIVQDDPVEHDQTQHEHEHAQHGKKHHKSAHDPSSHPAAVAMHSRDVAPETLSHEEQQQREEAPATDKPAKDFEALADSVLGTLVSEDTEQSTDESTRRGSKRRGRRGRGRGKGRSNEPNEQGSQQQETEVVAEELLDDDATSAGVVGEGEKSFEQAVAEFEASPRRKRKTRGNSRSDQRPRKEDFQPKKVEPVEVEEAPVQAAPKKSGQPVVEKVLDTRTSSSSRGRRRAVRRTTSVEQAQPAAKSEVKTAATAAPKTASKSESSQGSEQSRGRGRRRATRRTSKS
jgi:ribonuclease E